MKTIGPRSDFSEIECDPQKAFWRARALDAMLASARPAYKRGILRGTFAEFERLDQMRAIEIARSLNGA